jgi:SPP1 gp7 family putative phage head morphogenesis protein
MQALSSLLFDTMRVAESIGRSFVVEKDRFFSVQQRRSSARFYVGKHLVSASGLQWFMGADDAFRISFNLLPEEVIRALRKKAKWLAAVENQEAVNVLRREFEALERVLKEGKSYREFVQMLRESLGERLPRRLDVVFRTNLFASYSEAQLDQVAGMEDRFPYWRYVAILDSKTRPSHRELNGKVFNQGEGPIPPIDYNCRCSMQFIHRYEAERENPDVVKDPGVLLERMSSRHPGFKVREFDSESFGEWLEEQLRQVDPSIRRAADLLPN